MDSLKDIGAFLQSERNRQQISLEKLSRHTRISVRMLQALEAGEYEVIGTPLLIRGFLKVYCEALGVDPQPILEECGSDICRYDNEGERLKRYQSWMKGTRKKGGAFLALFLVLAFGVTAAGLWAVWWPKYQMKKAATTQAGREAVYPQQELPGDLAVKKGTGELIGNPAVEPALAPGVLPEQDAPGPLPDDGGTVPMDRRMEETPSEGHTAALPAAQKTESLPGPAVPSGSEHVLRIVADEEAWVQVQADDGKPQNRILKPGESAEWTLSRSAQLWTGNAGGIRVLWDGKPLKPLGKRGEVLRVKLPDPRYLENP
ncbi:helix-turn-helix domain-containing protein [Desulfosoma sp.]